MSVTPPVLGAKLISHSQGAFDDQGNQGFGDGSAPDALELIAFCARVSNPSNQLNSGTAEKLVKYLIKHRHWSPLEMVSATIEVTTTRDIARQILRHRSFSFQEFSQRYADPTVDLAFVTRDARLQDFKNRQNSIVVDDVKLTSDWANIQQHVIDNAVEAYNWAITNGIAKEQARSVLPEGCTVSKLYIAGTLRSWLHYIDTRTTVGTQLEHMVIARQCAVALAPIFPLIGEYTKTGES